MIQQIISERSTQMLLIHLPDIGYQAIRPIQWHSQPQNRFTSGKVRYTITYRHLRRLGTPSRLILRGLVECLKCEAQLMIGSRMYINQVQRIVA